MTVERLDSFARSLAIVVTYIMKIEHAFEKAVFASLPICTPSGSFALMIRMIAATGSDISSGTGVSSSAGRSLRLAPTPTVDSLVTSAWSDDDPPSGIFGAEAADATSYSEETFLRPSCSALANRAPQARSPGVFALANRSADMELRERREVSRLHRDEEQAIYEEVMLIDERCAKEEREEAARQRLNERKREREQAEDARKASPAARRQVKLPGGLAAASGESMLLSLADEGLK